MTRRARIGDFELVGHRRRDERKRVAADVHVGDRLLDLRHMARHTITAGAAARVMGMVFQSGRVRAIRRARPWQVRQISRAGLTSSASFAVPCESWQLKQVTPRRYIRLCHEIVALHPVLVPGAVGKVGKRRLPELVLLQLARSP